jgi:hypothetical protein
MHEFEQGTADHSAGETPRMAVDTGEA